ncbi:hypothetical protein AB3N04_05275 [Alkalihalophilus sp. As8PL]|uniref:Uncharacterized protein n=1 Tax=Alkalihalophilus sp. As8PL TaxID=3237103 RepID=A0AB39BVX1_9BACI
MLKKLTQLLQPKPKKEKGSCCNVVIEEVKGQSECCEKSREK